LTIKITIKASPKGNIPNFSRTLSMTSSDTGPSGEKDALHSL